MKVLMLNGSAHIHGNTYIALEEIGKTLKEEGIDYEIFQMGGKPVRDCIGCGQCTEKGCVFDDDAVNEFVAKAKEADGFVFGTPVYYAHPSGHVLSFLDRVFFSNANAFAGKVGASFAIARRAGAVSSFDVMNKYFGISNMIVCGSSYWNIGFGRTEGQFLEDKEGVQTAMNVAKNMSYVMKCLEAGKNAGIQKPEHVVGNFMHFIR